MAFQMWESPPFRAGRMSSPALLLLLRPLPFCCFLEWFTKRLRQMHTTWKKPKPLVCNRW